MPIRNITAGQIQAWIAIVVAIVAFGWNAYSFYDEAKHAHQEAIAANKTVTELTALVKSQQDIIRELRLTIKTLQDTLQSEKEMTQLQTYGKRKDELELWEKRHYCDLFKKYMGPNCDVSL